MAEASEGRADRRGVRAPLLMVAAGVALLVAVNLVDYITGYESLFFIFYFVPVAAYGWFLNRSSAQVMAFGCAVAWWLVDRLGGHHYAHEWYRLWNALTCYAAFALVGWGVSEIRRRLDEQRRLNQELAEALEALNRSTQEIHKLQSQFQTVCAWTKRIRVEDRWVSFEEFLESQLGIHVTHGLSEQAAEELRRHLEER
jgi:hypothetical protein